MLLLRPADAMASAAQVQSYPTPCAAADASSEAAVYTVGYDCPLFPGTIFYRNRDHNGDDETIAISGSMHDVWQRCVDDPWCKSFNTDRKLKTRDDINLVKTFGSGCDGIYVLKERLGKPALLLWAVGVAHPRQPAAVGGGGGGLLSSHCHVAVLCICNRVTLLPPIGLCAWVRQHGLTFRPGAALPSTSLAVRQSPFPSPSPHPSIHPSCMHACSRPFKQGALASRMLSSHALPPSHVHACMQMPRMR